MLISKISMVFQNKEVNVSRWGIDVGDDCGDARQFLGGEESRHFLVGILTTINIKPSLLRSISPRFVFAGRQDLTYLEEGEKIGQGLENVQVKPGMIEELLQVCNVYMGFDML